MTVLLTGVAGFIGMHVAARLAKLGHRVVGLDAINSYYDVQLKFDRLQELGIDRGEIEYGRTVTSRIYPNLSFVQGQLEDADLISRLFAEEPVDTVGNLAGQAGVRYSLEAPLSYVAANIEGFTVLLEAARQAKVRHFVYASTSSVYGLNETMPYSPHHATAHPVSLYAATKKANELFAHAYSHLYNLPTTGLRFFTVYGPWGRPDMAPALFARAILTGQPIKMFNYGAMQRDFTFVDDIVDGFVAVLGRPAQPDARWSALSPDPAASSAPYAVYNIGRGTPVELREFITTMEGSCGRAAQVILEPMQPGDVESTWADSSDLIRDHGYAPKVDLAEGLSRYVSWFRDYYRL